MSGSFFVFDTNIRLKNAMYSLPHQNKKDKVKPSTRYLFTKRKYGIEAIEELPSRFWANETTIEEQ